MYVWTKKCAGDRIGQDPVILNGRGLEIHQRDRWSLQDPILLFFTSFLKPYIPKK